MLGDCAEPDPVFSVPHPGSNRVNDASDAILAGEISALAGTYYGYERFVEETDFLLNRQA
ncbi:MAG: hypothetical protein JXM79_04125 [Sedimentisphaerales bacterium]|nr:hypothetical protein [Sedimentisphaerales bacterium]